MIVTTVAKKRGRGGVDREKRDLPAPSARVVPLDRARRRDRLWSRVRRDAADRARMTRATVAGEANRNASRGEDRAGSDIADAQFGDAFERSRPAEVAVQMLAASLADAARRVPSLLLYAIALLGLVFDFWFFVLTG